MFVLRIGSFWLLSVWATCMKWCDYVTLTGVVLHFSFLTFCTSARQHLNKCVSAVTSHTAAISMLVWFLNAGFCFCEMMKQKNRWSFSFSLHFPGKIWQFLHINWAFWQNKKIKKKKELTTKSTYLFFSPEAFSHISWASSDDWPAQWKVLKTFRNT